MALMLSAFLIFVYMSSWYVISMIKKRNDVADIAWGIGFILVSIINLIQHPSIAIIISTILISIWGIRLSLHIYTRNKNRGEDIRYKSYKKNAYIIVFMLQGLFMWLICLPLMHTNTFPTLKNLFGVVIWIIGFYFEATADRQLKDFVKNKQHKGEIMQEGLWAYSRHPNYFGEVTMWWGIWLLNLGQSFWTIVGPLTITFLITKVSGIPLLEKKYENNRAFQEYKKRVSVFIPLPPKY